MPLVPGTRAALLVVSPLDVKWRLATLLLRLRWSVRANRLQASA